MGPKTDDGTVLKVERAYNSSSPAAWLVLQLYQESGVPLGSRHDSVIDATASR